MKKSTTLFALILSGWLGACRSTDEPTLNPTLPQPLPSPTYVSASPPATPETMNANAISPISTLISPIFTPTLTPPTPTAAKSLHPLPAGSEALIAKAKEVLGQLPGLNLTAADISLMAVEPKQWRDTSLGCPREGMKYNQVITPGYLIILEAAGKQFEFHTNTRDTVVLCLVDGQDAIKVLQP